MANNVAVREQLKAFREELEQRGAGAATTADLARLISLLLPQTEVAKPDAIRQA